MSRQGPEGRPLLTLIEGSGGHRASGVTGQYRLEGVIKVLRDLRELGAAIARREIVKKTLDTHTPTGEEPEGGPSLHVVD